MKKLFLILIASILCTACKDDKKEVKEAISITEDTLLSTISTFQNCKANSTKRSDCRNAITKFISTTYHIDDFKNKNGEYVIYDSIQSIVSKSAEWKKIGNATAQENIDRAVEAVKNGSIALVIDTSKTYGHVVVVQSGELKNSGSWGLKLPVVLSLANHNPSKSFHDKSLGYAFKKSEDLKIFVRE